MRTFLFGIFIVVATLSSHAFAQVTTPSNPSRDGDITLHWPSSGSVTIVESKDGANGTVAYQGGGTSVTLTGRTNGSYEYQVFDDDGGGCHPWVGCVPSSLGTLTVTVDLLALPGSPASISAPSVSSGSFNVSWSAVSGEVDHYQLQEAVNGGAWVTAQSNTSTSKSFSKPVGNYYDYRVSACNQAGCSGTTNVARVTVALPVPSTPGAISAPSTANTGSYTVSWGSASNAAVYELQERMNGGSWATVHSNTSLSRSFSKPAGSYFDYRARACNTSGCSGYTANRRVTIPAASVSASASPSTNTYIPESVTLDWNSSMTTGCRIFGQALSGTNGSTNLNIPASAWQQDPTLNTWSASLVVTCDVIGGGTMDSAPTVVSATMYEQRPSVSASWNTPEADVNEGVVLSWTSSRADSCQLDGQNVALNGSQTFQFPTAGSHSKTVVCENLGGDRSASASVNISVPPAPTVSVFWSASSAAPGTPTTFSWSSTGADSCSMNGAGVATSGSTSFSFVEAGYYPQSVTCTNAGGSADDSATLAVIAPTADIPVAIDPADMSDTDDVFYGDTGGAFSVTPSGSARYSLPIEVAPGIAGVQPNLALTYSSAGKNGTLGWGWALSGLSSIHRCAANMVRDGYVSGVFDDDDYKLCLDGQRLVEVAPGEYRTERESGQKIEVAGEGYVRYLPNGRVLSYGLTSESRKAPLGGDALSWHLNQVEDAAGNAMSYHYSNDAVNGTLRIDHIRYTQNDAGSLPNRVTFYYEDREDMISAYRGGVLHLQDQRLANVDVTVAGSLVRRYVLDYEPYHDTNYADAAKISRIESVRICYDNANTQCTVPLQAQWAPRTSTDFAFNTSTLVPGSGGFDGYLIGDFDGDGHQEYVYQNSGSSPNVIYQTDRHSAPSYNSSQQRGVSNGRTVLDKADVNGDGKDDLILRDNLGQLFLSTAIDGGFADPTLLLSAAESKLYQIYFQDMNGDGFVDMYRNPDLQYLVTGDDQPESYERFDVALNDKAGGFEPFTQWGNRIGGYHSTLKLVDMNGDRLPDIVRCEYTIYPGGQETNKCRFTVSINTGTGFNDPVYWGNTEIDAMTWVRVIDAITNQTPPPEQHFVLVDVNGDSQSDIVWATKTDVQVAINTGRDFTPFSVWLNQDITPDSWYAPPFTMADVNGDQRPDLVFREEGNNNLHVAYNRGASAGIAHNGGFTYPRALGISSMFFMGMDVNDDGVADLAFAQADSDLMKNSRLNHNDVAINALPPLRVDAFHINAERRIDIDYALLNDPSVHTLGTGSGDTTGDIFFDRPVGTTVTVDTENSVTTTYQSVASSLPYVVNAVTTHNLLAEGGSSLTADYHYTGHLRHRAGWGSLGFAQVRTTRTVNETGEQTRTINDYDQRVGETYNAAGLLMRSTQYADDNAGELQRISETVNRWHIHVMDDGDSPHYRTVRDASHSQSQDLNGAAVANSARYFLPYSASAPSTCASTLTPNLSVLTSAHDGYDAFGNVHQSVTVVCDGQQTFTTAQQQQYDNRTSGQWRLGLVTNTRTTSTAPDANGTMRSLTRESAATYTALGLPQTLTREPNNSEFTRTTTYSNYDAYGHAQTVTESWLDSEGLSQSSRSATASTDYASDGTRTVTTTNAAGHESATVLNAHFGAPVSHTDANDLTTTYGYDALGRVITVTAPDGSTAETRYRTCNNCDAPSTNARYYVHSKVTGGAPQRSYFDALGRSVGQRILGLTGVPSYTHIEYNAAGRVHRVARPFFAGEDRHYSEALYDSLGRVTETTAANDGTTVTQYNGLEVSVINALGRNTVTWKNGLGQARTVQDDNGTQVAYAYDPFGNLEQTEVTPFDGSDSVVTTMGYDLLGRQLYLDDPSAGRVDYHYNGLGLMVASTDAEAQQTRFSYDVLGRQITRIDDATASNAAARTHEWFYDTPASGDGRLDSVIGFDTDGNPHNEFYSYNAYGLPTEQESHIDGEVYTTTTHYDDFNRPVAIDYPTGYRVVNHFNDFGYRHQVVDGVDGNILWTATDADAQGNITHSTHGNGVNTVREYNPQTGLVESIHALGNQGLVVQNQDFQFDVLGNLVERADLRVAFVEAFCYDNLDRLKAVRENSCSAMDEDITYDALGNIQTRVMPQGDQPTFAINGGVQVYTYSDANPYRLASTNMAGSYGYDANGNITSGDGRTITYSAFDKPTQMTKDGNVVDITYGSDQMRIKRVDNNSITTIYVAGIYEKQTEGQQTKHIHYVGDIALHVWEEDTATITDTYTRFLHHDHIGSLVAKTNEEADSVDDVEWLANDPWGLRREESWLGIVLGTDYVPTDTRKAFTGHEHLDGVGLIHMNGRVYDPNIGRFLSPDPIVQAPHNTQSFNRYAYVFNNPLRYTDPTGYTAGGNSADQEVSQGCEATPNCTVIFIQSSSGVGPTDIGDDNVDAADRSEDDAGGSNSGGGSGGWTQDGYWDGGNVYTNARRNGTPPRLRHYTYTIDGTRVNEYDPTFGAVANQKFIEAIVPGSGAAFAVQNGEGVGAAAANMAADVTGFKKVKTGFNILNGLGKKIKSLGKKKKQKTCCFVAGTQVLTKDGYKNIEDVELGELLYSKNVDTGEQDFKPVTRLYKKYRLIYELSVVSSDGVTKLIETTDDHPFYVPGKGFVDTIDLVPGDQIETDGIGPVTVESVVDSNRYEDTYNFEVADFHTYYATRFNVLVHNCGGLKTIADRMNAQVEIKNGAATVSFKSRRATSLSTENIKALKLALRENGVKNVTVNSGQIVEPTGRLKGILQTKADQGGTWSGLNVWATGNPKNEFVLTGTL